MQLLFFANNKVKLNISMFTLCFSEVCASYSVQLGSTSRRKVLVEEHVGNKATRTSSIPEFGHGREVRRTRSVSEGRKTIFNRDDGLDDSPTPQLSTDLSISSTEEVRRVPPKTSAYHTLEKITKFHKGESCTACRKNMHVLFAPGVQCTECKQFFHKNCEQSGMIYRFPCVQRISRSVDCGEIGESSTGSVASLYKSSSTTSAGIRRKNRKQMKVPIDMTKPGKFSLTKTSEFTDRTDQIISGVEELLLMQEFISKKVLLATLFKQVCKLI